MSLQRKMDFKVIDKGIIGKVPGPLIQVLLSGVQGRAATLGRPLTNQWPMNKSEGHNPDRWRYKNNANVISKSQRMLQIFLAANFVNNTGGTTYQRWTGEYREKKQICPKISYFYQIKSYLLGRSYEYINEVSLQKFCWCRFRRNSHDLTVVCSGVRGAGGCAPVAFSRERAVIALHYAALGRNHIQP